MLGARYNAHVERERIIGESAFQRVSRARAGVAVYRGSRGYARIGAPDAVRALKARHRAFAAAGFPVASIKEEGTQDGEDFYIEASLGAERLGIRFRREWEAGMIPDSTFEIFMAIMLEITAAQISAGSLFGRSDLAAGIHLEEISSVQPEDARRLRARFDLAMHRLASMPVVACHGDLNPQNMFADGIIDFEDAFAGPLGYDQVSAIYTTELNPVGAQYEFPAHYRFSADQISRYYRAIDERFVAAGSPALSTVRRDLEFCRSVWAAHGMDAWPQTQAWRFRHLEMFLDDTIAV